MAPHVKKGGKTGKIPFHELLQDALANDDDFIVTYEVHPDEGTQDIHILRGKLITPCMLGTLKNRINFQQGEGSIIVTRVWKTIKIRDPS
jgi:hypothetical protein